MNFLYILKSKVKLWHYIGITMNIVNRLAEHNNGEVKSTKAYRPFIVVHQESFSLKTNARKREIFLKKNARARKELFENFNASIV